MDAAEFFEIIKGILVYIVLLAWALFWTWMFIQFFRELIKTDDWKWKDIPRNLFALSVYALIGGGLWYLIVYKFIGGMVGEVNKEFRWLLLRLLGCDC